MKKKLQTLIPTNAIEKVESYLKQSDVNIKIVPKRNTLHGDYRKRKDGSHLITLNKIENPYRFLITLIHELSHFVTFQRYGTKTKPHGIEWKTTFIELMQPFLNKDIFPEHLLSVLKIHFKNPKASSDTDTLMALELIKYDKSNNDIPIVKIPKGGLFKTPKGRYFVKGEQLRKRYICQEKETGKIYLFYPHVKVKEV